MMKTNEPQHIWNLSLQLQFIARNNIDAIYYVSKCKAKPGKILAEKKEVNRRLNHHRIVFKM